MELSFRNFVERGNGIEFRIEQEGIVNTTKWNLTNLIVRRPLLAFFVFSYAFFWLVLAFSIACIGISGISPDQVPGWVMAIIVILGSWMPNLAAVIVTGTLEGRAGVKQLLGKFLQWRIAPRWVFAALIPFPVAFTAVGIYRLAGGAAPWKCRFILRLLGWPDLAQPG